MNYVQIGLLGGVTIVVIGLGRYTYKTYNELIYHRMQSDKQASNVEVHLKKKFDVIPALVEVVKGYTKHEKGVFEEVTRLRSQWGKSKNINQKMKTANLLESALSKLLVVQERYPRLKANKNFLGIQKNISRVEKELVRERKYYNQRVKAYNVRLQLFPKNIIAKLFRFEEKPFFSLEENK